MGTGARIAAAVASGYLLGRRHKLRLAVVVGGLIAGKRLSTDPRHLARQAQQLIESNEQLSELSDQVRTQLFEAARLAAVKVATDRVTGLSENLQGRTKQLLEAAESGTGADRLKAVEAGEEPEPDTEESTEGGSPQSESSEESAPSDEEGVDDQRTSREATDDETPDEAPDDESSEHETSDEESGSARGDASKPKKSAGPDRSSQKRSAPSKKSGGQGSRSPKKTSQSSGQRS